ncbi:MAG: DUF5818 domain-containing protein [Bryobacteraceae bacterium]
MNKAAFCVAVAFLAAGAGFAQSPKTYTGEIMDSACAKTGSHAAMEKEHGMKNAKDCTLGCVKGGAKFVLYDGSKSWDLDDQTKPEAFAGQKVKVTGTLDTATNTIHVQDIKR